MIVISLRSRAVHAVYKCIYVLVYSQWLPGGEGGGVADPAVKVTMMVAKISQDSLGSDGGR